MGEMLVDEADFVIVGTGAGGATAARVLTEAGRSVVLLEEGPSLRKDERPRELLAAMATGLRDFGTVTTAGTHPIPLLQGRLVGGSTAVNSGIIWRLPEDVRADWAARFGLGELVDRDALDRTFERLEDELAVTTTPQAIWGGNVEKMAEAARRMGLPGKPMARNTPTCEGRGQCLQGCPGESRQSMDVSYIPRAVERGARVHALARAERIVMEGKRAVGVDGVRLDPTTKRPMGRFRMHARQGVIVAAGALHTPILLRRSGFRGKVGERFQAHPGVAIVARFDEPIAMGFGASQGYEVPLRDRRLKLESLTLPPELLAARLPGVGAEWQERLAALDHYAQWCTIVRMEALGRVREGFGGHVDARYSPTKEDLARAQEGIVLLCKMFFAVGAREVYPNVGGVPEVLTDATQLRPLERHPLPPGAIHFMISHMFGTACAHADPREGVVGPDLAVHGASGLYVMDASVFPTNLGVNPQHSIMAIVWRAAERLANEQRAAAGA